MRYFFRFFLLVSFYIISIYSGYAQCPTLPDTIVVCSSNPIDTPYVLAPSGIAKTYLWSTGATTNSISVSNKGRYWVRMTLPSGDTCTDTITFGVWGQGNKGNYQWYFGQNTGLDFLSGTPTPKTTVLNTSAGSSTISDPTGHTLLYTNGNTIYNSNNQVIQGGANLGGDTTLAQSSLIVPSQKENNIYYSFTITKTGQLQYSTVDLSKNQGQGAVDTTVTLPGGSVSPELAGVYDSAGGFWVATVQGGQLVAYHVTNSGVSTTASPSQASGQGSYIKFSDNGEEAAQVVGNEVIVYQFSKKTGQFSSPVVITNVTNPYAVEFAKDGSELYVSTGSTGHIYQYDPTATTTALIDSSRYLLTKDSSITYYGLQLAEDGNIYVAQDSTGKNYLSVISSATSDSLGVEFHKDSISLGAASNKDLPNFVSNYFTTSNVTIELKGACTGNPTELYGIAPDSANMWVWHFGDGSSFQYTSPAPYSYIDSVTHSYSPGTYTVSLVITTAVSSKFASNQCSLADSGTVTIYQTPNPSLTSQAFCNVTTPDTLNAGTYYAGSTTLGSSPIIYSWTNRTGMLVSSSQKLTTDTSGIYILVVDNNGCLGTTSDTITFVNLPKNFLGNDTTLCTGKTDIIGAPAIAGVSTIWNTGTPFSNNDSILVTSSAAGSTKYIATLTTSTTPTCSVKDSVTITFVQVPVVNLGPNVTVCDGTIETLDAQNAGYDYLWSTGSTAEIIKVTTTGIYYVTVYLGSCAASDTVTINYEAYPVINLPSEDVYCSRDQSYVNLFGGLAASYLWQPGGQTTDSIQVSTPGTYVLEAFSAVAKCQTRDSVKVEDICTPQLFVPAAFSPNGDGKNDIFQIYGNHILTYDMRVFDKWGELIFVSADLTSSWDGTYRDQPVEQGVYTWKITYTGQTLNGTTAKVQEGNVTVLR